MSRIHTHTHTRISFWFLSNFFLCSCLFYFNILGVYVLGTKIARTPANKKYLSGSCRCFFVFLSMLFFSCPCLYFPENMFIFPRKYVYISQKFFPGSCPCFCVFLSMFLFLVLVFFLYSSFSFFRLQSALFHHFFYRSLIQEFTGRSLFVFVSMFLFVL